MEQQMDRQLFLELYAKYQREIFNTTLKKFKSVLDEMRSFGFWSKMGVPSPGMAGKFPISRTHARLKRPESMVDKIKRKPDKYPQGLSQDSLLKMNDVIGGRIIVHVLSDLVVVDRLLRNSKDLELWQDELPEAYVARGLVAPLDLSGFEVLGKESGYVSLHYTMRLQQHLLENLEPIRCEIQVRTLIEDAWAQVEHMWGYKPDKGTSLDVKGRFKAISNVLQSVDNTFDEIASDLAKSQQDAGTREISDKEQLNPEIFPILLEREKQLTCLQREIDILIKLLASTNLDTAGKLRAALQSPRYILIESIYLEEEKRAPATFEVIACLPHVLYSNSDEEATKLIKGQIAYSRLWKQIK